MSIRLGYQIPNFTYPGTPADIVPTVLAQAREAEAGGFDTVLVMDHFYQLPGIGKPEEPMLEAYTLLAAIAAATESVQLSTLVTGNTYRNPAMLAKTVTTLDLVSAGRAVLAIGAGWYELEHQQMGYEFGTFTDRFERLDEALQIIEPMLRGRHPEVDGKWYQAHSTLNEPRVRDDLPIMLGGGGEKKTFGLAARYADHLNIICNASELPRKLDALAQRCEEAGRDRDTIETSFLAFTMIDEDGDAARRMQREYLIKTGVDYDNLDDEGRAAATDRMFVGSPDEVAEQIQRRVLDVGVDGITINLVPNGHIPGVVELAGKTLAPLVK
ncbi:TIGR03560 family F420-dependent LLM class oxidoreductase [Williamsia maris]|uniref:F420-dependent oxidoreductase, Rv1855c family n=1 Tax=Williamsia maris TaxID=72806 RepID=A0ABT1HDY1_9NOCA|nr:TIGR03560 family F420-dependent LLM class oxidoreductase [Williamsia maris]MCP2176389.1 putative F420-dependent oxidoreductase, Rv1855c family [Williamsia maris]